MAAITRTVHDVGALSVWDLSHSAGAMPVDLGGCDETDEAGELTPARIARNFAKLEPGHGDARQCQHALVYRMPDHLGFAVGRHHQAPSCFINRIHIICGKCGMDEQVATQARDAYPASQPAVLDALDVGDALGSTRRRRRGLGKRGGDRHRQDKAGDPGQLLLHVRLHGCGGPGMGPAGQ